MSFGSFWKKADREHDEDPVIDLGLCTHQKSDNVFFEDEPCTSTQMRPATHSTHLTLTKKGYEQCTRTHPPPERLGRTNDWKPDPPMLTYAHRNHQLRLYESEKGHVQDRLATEDFEKLSLSDRTQKPYAPDRYDDVHTYKGETVHRDITAVHLESEAGATSSIVKLAEALTGAITRKATQSHLNPAEGDFRRFVARQTIERRELPAFSGSPEEWPIFEEHYNTSSKQCQFNDAGNMARLRKVLRGRARELVSALLALPRNVDRVMSTLQSRFGRPDFIVQSLKDKTESIPVVRDGDLLSLIDFANVVNNTVSTMELLKSESHLRNPELRQQLLSKLPHAMQLQWGENLSAKFEAENGGTTPREFAKWLGDHADADSLIVSQKEVGLQRSDPKKEKPSLGTTHCFQVGMDCKEAEKQLAELPLNQRREFVLKKGLCFNCLRANHRVWQCRARSGYTKCKRKHHELCTVLNPRRQVDP